MAELRRYQNFIDGKWVEPRSGRYYPDVNPADDRDLIGEFPLSDAEDVRAAVGRAQAAQRDWGRLTPPQRERPLERFLQLLARDARRLAEVICREEGKTLAEAQGETGRGVEETRWFLGEGRRLEGITMPSDRPGVLSVAARVPLGVVAAITPWNFPVLTPLRKILPALVTGNTVVFKPASDTPHSAVALLELFEEAGLPAGVVNLLTGPGGAIGDELCGDPRVRGITFTGSTAVGRRIHAAAAPHFTRVQLEMGGKNPAIVVDCRRLERTAGEIASAAFAVSGQRCTSISRLIVHRELAEELEARIVEKARAYVAGDGRQPGVTLGPLINRTAGENVLSSIQGAVAAGARVRTGGRRLGGGLLDRGFWIEPTLLTEVTPAMKAANEEIFGPVLVSIRVDSFEQALEVANGTAYGLAACLFTDNLELIPRFQRDVAAGMTHVNHGTVTDSGMPFGGVKASGLGPFSKGATNKDFFTTWKVNYLKLAAD